MNIVNEPNDPNNNLFTRGRRHHHGDSRVLLGLIFVAIGALLIFENLDLIPYDLSHILISWPMLLIVIGVYNLTRKAGSAGIILIGIGTYFMLPRIFDLPDHFFRNFWPLILIIVGLAFIFQWRRTPGFQFTADTDKKDIIDETAIFGGRNFSLVSDQFKGGKITAIFGGSKINLLYCKPVEGCTIDVATIFGGTKIIVPENWNVKTEVVSIFGGFEDKRGNSVISRVDQSKIVTIKGVAIFGGGEISSMP
ncbi:MAG: cell wall-active antibiotics response protein [Marinilabiliales bacterium]|nr:cell wall-active antibiotics response protein [Marinilabiliales bacterium]